MADVFISYHRSDGVSALVRRIAGELESRGISCWYDTKNTAPVDFVERIVTEIECCKVFLFIWDEKANEDSKQANSYVRSEIQCAYGEKRIALFPFQVGNFEQNKTLKFYFGHINIPYGGDSPETAQTEEFVKAIADALGKPQNLPVITQSQPATTRIIKSGKCGDNITYTLDENGVLTISGNGSIWDFEWDSSTQARNTPWWNERNIIFNVEIQNGVTVIGRGAFYSCTKLKSIHIPNSVTYIKKRVLWDCAELISVNIPNSVTAIRYRTFKGCTGLTSIHLPDSITYIGVEAFGDCVELTSINIPDSVTYIGQEAFFGCEKLQSVSVPAKTEIHPDAFPPTVRVTRREPAANQ